MREAVRQNFAAPWAEEGLPPAACRLRHATAPPAWIESLPAGCARAQARTELVHDSQLCNTSVSCR
jgi:hypothetical protein